MRGRITACVAIVLALGCETGTSSLDAKKPPDAPVFATAQDFLSITQADSPLCRTGTTSIEFQAEGEQFGFAMYLNRGDVLKVSTTGDADLDTVLFVYGPANDDGFFGAEPVTMDDDAGDGLLAAIPGWTALADGEYLVLLTTVAGKGKGPVALTVDAGGETGCIAAGGAGRAKLDLLFVVDDSPSMCQEQRALTEGIPRFLDALKAATGPVDLRVAVTTTNVCPATQDSKSARGRFVYQPAVAYPLPCRETRVVPCSTDADCQARLDLPDRANWVCDFNTATGGGLADLYTCDMPPAVAASTGTTDKYDGDVLFSLKSTCHYLCDPAIDRCETVFGAGSRCVYPGSGATSAGCILPPPTTSCPANGPTIVDGVVVAEWTAKYEAGDWIGEPDWKGLSGDLLRRKVAERLIGCMTTVGAQQAICGNQEQGLRAAWMALDPEGENADQARAFVREDAALLVAIVADEDDCSAATDTIVDPKDGKTKFTVIPDDFQWCACLYDDQGCTPSEAAAGGSACDPARCVTNGAFDAQKCPLISPATFAEKLKSLKADPALIVLAPLVGVPVPGSDATPEAGPAQIGQQFATCKCDRKSPRTAPYVYGCSSDSGTADLGLRYVRAAELTGSVDGVGSLCEIGVEGEMSRLGTVIGMRIRKH